MEATSGHLLSAFEAEDEPIDQKAQERVCKTAGKVQRKDRLYLSHFSLDIELGCLE